jgi:hypothetical protein
LSINLEYSIFSNGFFGNEMIMYDL